MSKKLKSYSVLISLSMMFSCSDLNNEYKNIHSSENVVNTGSSSSFKLKPYQAIPLLMAMLINNSSAHYACFQTRDELQEAVNNYTTIFPNVSSPVACPTFTPGPIAFENTVQKYGCIADWCTSNMDDMTALFGLKEDFNEKIGGWDVSNVRKMRSMFWGARSYNQDISGWDVSNVVSMEGMFSFATNFNQDISSWDVTKVTNMKLMFGYATNFNQDISSWDVSNVTNMQGIFYAARNFDRDLCVWGEKLSPGRILSFMFTNTSCPERGDPDLNDDPQGPFCNLCTSAPTASPTPDTTLIPSTKKPSLPCSTPPPVTIIIDMPTVVQSDYPTIAVQDNNDTGGLHGRLQFWFLGYLLFYIWFKSLARE